MEMKTGSFEPDYYENTRLYLCMFFAPLLHSVVSCRLRKTNQYAQMSTFRLYFEIIFRFNIVTHVLSHTVGLPKIVH